MARLSQKQVTQSFLEMCKDAGVPTTPKTPSGRKRGYFRMGGAYGMIRVEYVIKGTSGAIWDVSGYRNAREMLVWLSNFDPKSAYKYYKEREKGVLESEKRRDTLRKQGRI
ncbi:MAG: hypothetical protein WC489_06195 [Patescibacteria group bacterium]